MTVQSTCPDCAGECTCPVCAGRGWRYVVFNARARREVCRFCNGVGTCPTCEGEGAVRRKPAEIAYAF